MNIFGLFKPKQDDNQPATTANGDLFNVQPYPAPELVGLENWINSDPLNIESLKGKVVQIDFWTFGCINCVHTLPHVQQLQNQYKDQGLVIIGVHAPEFDFEKELERVKQAVKDRKLAYPIAQDNQMKTWRAYANNYWPAQYLIDKQGMVRRTHFGEGEYKETDQAIQALLSE